MKKRMYFFTSAFMILLMIFDGKTALTGAKDGITLCLHSVIPSLLPFIFFSGILIDSTGSSALRIFRPLGKLTGIPEGGENILLLGLVGGYPIGAQTVYTAYKSGKLSKNTARRLLGFCSNAGPSFIFGMGLCLFESPVYCWIIWAIHIISSLFVGAVIPGKNAESISITPKAEISISKHLEKTIKTMGIICGWVILFRMLYALINRWILWFVPKLSGCWIIGFLELTNGTALIQSLENISDRFILFSTFLGFGGICVGLQTMSVTGDLGMGMYFPGKTLQSIVSFLLSNFVSLLIFKDAFHFETKSLALILPIILGLVIIRFQIKRNNSSIFSNNVV